MPATTLCSMSLTWRGLSDNTHLLIKKKQGTYRDPTPLQTWSGYVNDAYGEVGRSESILGHDSNYAGAESWGPLASQSQADGGYTMVRISYTMPENHSLIALSYEAKCSIC